MAVAFFLVSVLVIVAPAAYAVEHVVGDSGGWTNSGDYSTWAAGKTFNVGDTLLFNYGTSHGVDVVSKSDYDNCVSSNAIDSHTDGRTTIRLTQPGPMYFTCPSFGHCTLGMKLAINVAGKTTTTPSAGNNQLPPSATTPTDENNQDPPSATTPTDENNQDPPSATTPSTPSTRSNADIRPNAVAGLFGNINMVVIGISLILAPLCGFMC